jgi:transcription elongation factor Elf1
MTIKRGIFFFTILKRLETNIRVRYPLIIMPFKDLNKKRAYARELYQKQRNLAVKRVSRRKKEIKKWIEDYKKMLKCSSCGENHPGTLDFHHKNQKDKEKGICYFVSNGYSIYKIKNEIQKCQTLCSNCHRKLHYQTAIFKRH